jgi:hypothetical protein
MRSVRSFFFTLAGLTFVAVVALFTASLGLLLAGAISVVLLGQALAGLLSYQPAPATVRARAERRRAHGGQHLQRELRVWNDGKGTIIDM